MDMDTAELHKHAFRLHGKPLTFVRNQSRDVALDFLNDVYTNDRGLNILHGPSLSGKTTVVQHFIDALPASAAVATIDCSHLDTGAFLAAILTEFGFELDSSTVNEQLNFLKVFLVQHTSNDSAPLLFIENAQEMDTIVYHCLCQLAKTRCHGQNALRVVMISDCLPKVTTDPRAMITHEQFVKCVMGPMTEVETADYILAKLRAAGSETPEDIMPQHLSKEIFRGSEGYPGLVDRLMMLRMQEAKDTPMLFVTLNGKTVKQVRLDKPRFLIGRSDINDISINSSFMSRHHAMLVQQGEATLLIDLNSTNGVFVNSKRVASHVLQHNDIISLGNHGIKIVDPNLQRGCKLDRTLMEDTEIMKVLNDPRRGKASEHKLTVLTLS
ncbi:MAG: FHA domain-containing protein [Woeseiaceae bacterium]|nr:FHA domain-containing protein [Woeseiaceae bacterium]